MIKKEMVKVAYCDNCEKRLDYAHPCDGCGSTHCYDCKHFYKEFPNGVYHSGGDLRLCTECLKEPPEKIRRALKAYQLIESLRAESANFYKSFKPRQEAAEKEVSRIYDELRDARYSK